jgi:hypothetical protein
MFQKSIEIPLKVNASNDALPSRFRFQEMAVYLLWCSRQMTGVMVVMAYLLIVLGKPPKILEEAVNMLVQLQPVPMCFWVTEGFLQSTEHTAAPRNIQDH